MLDINLYNYIGKNNILLEFIHYNTTIVFLVTRFELYASENNQNCNIALFEYMAWVCARQAKPKKLIFLIVCQA